MKYTLGIIGSEAYDMTSNEKIYTMKIEISKDVLDWLDMHDVEMVEGKKIFIVNRTKYTLIDGISTK